MAVVAEPRTGAKPGSDGPADVFVAFGITGDLAKVMTFGTGRRHTPWVVS